MFSEVLNQLQPFAHEFSRHGKKIFLVGGAVRNILLGKAIKDFDFTTDALPTEVQSYFRKVLPTGLQHGTVTVLFQGESYEVTTFRVDGEYTDGRRPDGVKFTPNLEEDLKRRDFTINAIALDLIEGSLHDPHDGQSDLKNRVLRAIGDPGKRFDEDALRLLRLFRFAAQLGFTIDETTLAAVKTRRHTLTSVSRERIREELFKTLSGTYPLLGWQPLYNLGFLPDIFQAIEPVNLQVSAWSRLNQIPTELRWSFWFSMACPYDPSKWEHVLKGLTVSNQDTASILGPPKALGFILRPEPVPELAKAIIEAWGTRERVTLGIEFLNSVELEGLWKDERDLKTEILRAAKSGEPIFIGELAVNGRDILSWGVSPGPSIGIVLKMLQRKTWNEPGLNSFEELYRLFQELPR